MLKDEKKKVVMYKYIELLKFLAIFPVKTLNLSRHTRTQTVQQTKNTSNFQFVEKMSAKEII